MGKNNPFTPTFGKVPPHLAGREGIIEDMAYAFDNGPGDPNLSTILVGPRGSGKTALLSSIAREASAHGWITASVSATPGMLDDILQRAQEAAGEFVDSGKRPRVREIGIPQIVSLELEKGEEQVNWRTKMNRFLAELDRNGIGLLISIDEVTVELGEMVQFASVYQHFVREDRRVGLVMAGLPYQVSELITDKRISFLRRSRQRKLGRISNGDVENAFLATVEDAGKGIVPEALDAAVAAAGGFPFMMQLVGYRTWAASRGDTITLEDAERGIAQAADEFRAGVIETTYGELSKNDRRFCGAMLEDAHASDLSDIARRMGVKSNYAAQYKKRLLLAGVIAERGGSLAFDIPGFREYLEDLAR